MKDLNNTAYIAQSQDESLFIIPKMANRDRKSVV